MDGCPFAKDVIPVRLHLAGIPADLTPACYGRQQSIQCTILFESGLGGRGRSTLLQTARNFSMAQDAGLGF
jgi:hypothetical protein